MAASRLAMRRNAIEPVAVRLCRQADRLASAGRLAEAEALYRTSLAVDPALASAHNNLGNLLRARGGLAAAAAAYRAALRSGLEAALVFYNLAAVWRQMGGLTEAAVGYRVALSLDPGYAEAWNNQANLWRDQDRLRDAAFGYRRAVAIRPDWADGHDNFASALYLLHERGDAPVAARLARDWRSDHPDNPMARHIGSAIVGDSMEARAPDAYVRQTFDLFAAEFDNRLDELGYRAPALLAEAVAASGPPPVAGLEILDAGCGTGLCAAALRPFARGLAGVDLSGGMLERARARGLYDHLEEAELVAHLAANPNRYDLIVAADVFCYFGDLAPAFAAAFAALRPSGRLVLSVERLEDDDAAMTYRVGTHGRYAHRESYLRAALVEVGFALLDLRVDGLRLESGQPVMGVIAVASRP